MVCLSLSTVAPSPRDHSSRAGRIGRLAHTAIPPRIGPQRTENHGVDERRMRGVCSGSRAGTKLGFVTSPVLSFHSWKSNDRFAQASGEFCVSPPADFSPRSRRGCTPKTGEATQLCDRMPLSRCEMPLVAQGRARLTKHRGCPRALLRVGVPRCCSGASCRYGPEDAGDQGLTPRGVCLTAQEGHGGRAEMLSTSCGPATRLLPTGGARSTRWRRRKNRS